MTRLLLPLLGSVLLGSTIAGAALSVAAQPAQAVEVMTAGALLTHADSTTPAITRVSMRTYTRDDSVDPVFFTREPNFRKPGYECVPVAEVAIVSGREERHPGTVCRAVSQGTKPEQAAFSPPPAATGPAHSPREAAARPAPKATATANATREAAAGPRKSAAPAAKPAERTTRMAGKPAKQTASRTAATEHAVLPTPKPDENTQRVALKPRAEDAAPSKPQLRSQSETRRIHGPRYSGYAAYDSRYDDDDRWQRRPPERVEVFEEDDRPSEGGYGYYRY